MKVAHLLMACIICLVTSAHAADTMYFKISNPWNTIKDELGKYRRKVVANDSGYLSLDYNLAGILVVRGYYTDTNFNRKLYTHIYFDETKGYKSGIRNYENGRLNGIMAGFNEQGDTLWRQTMQENAIVDSKEFPGYTSKPQTFTLLEKAAKFPGGSQGWIAFLSNNLRYPKEAAKKKIEGTVKVSFVVSKEGGVANVTVVQSAHPLLDAEAVRLIQSSPRWEPAVQNGRAVIYMATQSISFKL